MAETDKKEVEVVEEAVKDEPQVQPAGAAGPSPEEELKQQEALLRKKYGDVKGGSSALLQKSFKREQQIF